MENYNIAVIYGDGIGKEVIDEGLKVLKYINSIEEKHSFSFRIFPWGSKYYKENGIMMPKDGIEQLSKYDAIYLGAIGDPSIPDHITLRELLLKIRIDFDQYVNLRPIKLLRGAPENIKLRENQKIDMTYIRENTEGEYCGIGEYVNVGTSEEAAHQVSIFSKKGVERIIEYAFNEAKNKGKKLTSISKGNALNYSMVYWDKKFKEISERFPEVKTEELLVDAAAMLMITEPSRFEVIVSSNLFGDILTDLGAAITGGMGLATGANINPSKTYPSMFEPIHGSAPAIAGKNIANPFASIWSIGQMMTHFGFKKWEPLIIEAMEKQMIDGKILTPDLLGSNSTSEVGDEFVRVLEEVHNGQKR